ncbi:MAG: stage 0 sporulation family protein [Oscillospiraceae bacterium]|jgi:cell fate regulator YaaT (PSP1 superfamily)|nr:stage 0 sporulation family protein [Oscillospiraceae bacterium]MBQ8011888.1 stage 0 sporulation family protein [Oscillospiraceae bacterium]MBQ9111034.1 stage 0 sporulation family protein [Oscillospiraceae bacterium]
MIEIVGVRFQNSGKIYYFAPNGLQLPLGTQVVVETARGLECGTIAIANRNVEDASIVSPLKSVLRIMTKEDYRNQEQARQKEKRAFTVCEQKIEARGLKMKLVDVSCTFDNSKLLFYFTAESRVDFRELVKDLASVFRMRIELRQIGVRDEAKMFGGLGVCGREFCCRGYLGDFQPVSIKMAKEQGLSLNPTKISGTCGRLMCCLKHEQAVYEDLQKITPRIGSFVKTPNGRGKVEDANLITGKLRIKPEKEDDVPYYVDRSEVEILREGKNRVSKEERELRKLEDK